MKSHLLNCALQLQHYKLPIGMNMRGIQQRLHRPTGLAAAGLLAVLALTGFITTAQRVVTTPGIKNFGKVNDNYFGGPSAQKKFVFDFYEQHKTQSRSVPLYDREDRYPVVESDEVEPSDPVKRAKLKIQKQRYNKDAPFSDPGPKGLEVAFLPEWQFDFPALPVTKSDVIVVGEVLNAEAHRSENKRNVFSNFELKVEEVLKGSNLTAGSVINVQRVGGFVNFPDGRKVLFRLLGNGMPEVGARYALFLNVLDEDYRILTGYELGAEGVMPLDSSSRFETYRRANEADFLKTLRSHVNPDNPVK